MPTEQLSFESDTTQPKPAPEVAELSGPERARDALDLAGKVRLLKEAFNAQVIDEEEPVEPARTLPNSSGSAVMHDIGYEHERPYRVVADEARRYRAQLANEAGARERELTPEQKTVNIEGVTHGRQALDAATPADKQAEAQAAQTAADRLAEHRARMRRLDEEGEAPFV